MKTLLLLFFLVSFSALVSAQCEIQNRIQSDGTMLYFFEATPFYTTKSKALKICILTDKENYFIALQPTPFPLKEIGKKIKDDLVIHLSDNKKYKLEHYDTRYLQHDSIFQVLYLIDKKDLQSFSNYEAVSAEINMKGTEFIRTYDFKLHKKAIMKQLSCFLKEENK